MVDAPEQALGRTQTASAVMGDRHAVRRIVSHAVPLHGAEASRGRDLCPRGDYRTAEEMAAGVDAETEPGRSRVGLHLKLSDPLDADGLHHDDVAVRPVPRRRG